MAFSYEIELSISQNPFRRGDGKPWSNEGTLERWVVLKNTGYQAKSGSLIAHLAMLGCQMELSKSKDSKVPSRITSPDGDVLFGHLEI